MFAYPDRLTDSEGGVVKNGVMRGFVRAVLAINIPCLLASKWNIHRRDSNNLMREMFAAMTANEV